MHLFDIKEKAVRDLAWACFSQPLFTDVHAYNPQCECSHFSFTEQRQHWIKALDGNPEALHRHLQSRDTRLLGLYFEALLEFFLLQDAQLTLIEKNLQVREAKRTIGEFDFIYFCKQRAQHFHWEVTVKFYLGFILRDTTDLRQWSHWYGPNCVDRLDLKLHKMLNQQVKLAEHSQVQAKLAALGIKQLQPQVSIHGYLFYPPGGRSDATCRQ